MDSRSDIDTHSLIIERVRYLTDCLGLEENIIFDRLIHLKSNKPYDFINHDKWASKIPIEKFIDHTLLKPEANDSEFEKLLREAKSYKLGYVCVPPCRVESAVRTLQGDPVKVVSVMGFPHGNGHTSVKVYEASFLLSIGAHELDMVLNLGLLFDRKYGELINDISAVVKEAKKQKPDCVVKVILETCFLNKSELIDASILAIFAGADFIKTSTGFSSAGARIEDVRTMKMVVGDSALVKAAGGIKTHKDALLMLQNGASRIGTSNGGGITHEKTMHVK